MERLFLCCLLLFFLSSCSYSDVHQGMKMMREEQCYKYEGEAQAECLESVNYSVEEYEQQREELLGKD